MDREASYAWMRDRQAERRRRQNLENRRGRGFVAREEHERQESNRNTAVRRRYHKLRDKNEALYRQMRRQEEIEREGDLAFACPVFWFCWRSQCAKLYHPPAKKRGPL